MAKRKGSKKKYDLIGLLDRNLIGDGICDMISGVVGGPAGTNYGENISTMAITKVFSVPVLAVAAVIAMIVSFFTPLIGDLRHPPWRLSAAWRSTSLAPSPPRVSPS